jgi:hypothetical protein
VIISPDKCGIPLNLENSTFFGSIRISFRSCDEFLLMSVPIMLLIASLFHCHVDQAISKCGVFASDKSRLITSLSTLNPRGNLTGEEYSIRSIKSLRRTTSLFGLCKSKHK